MGQLLPGAGAKLWWQQRRAVQDHLRNVKQVSATGCAFAALLANGCCVYTYAAFAAILADGSVVTWGFADSGGFPVLQFKISSDAQAFFQ
jgi:hypothetical protein